MVFGKEDPLIMEIQNVVKQVEKTENLPSTKEVMLGTLLLDDEEISDWKICNPKKENFYNDEAHLYFVGKRLISFHIRLGTPTGDWGEHRYYCYREDETLAFISYECWSFCDGNIKIEAKLYFDPKGKKIKEVVKYMDLETDRPVKAQKGLYQPPEIYLKTSDALKKFAKDLKGVTPPWTTFK